MSRQISTSLVLFLLVSLLVPAIAACGGETQNTRTRKRVTPKYQRVVFLHDYREDYRLGTTELKQLQFYLSNTIKLRREVTDDKSRVVTPEGRLVIQDGKAIDEVEIVAGTPCIATEVGAEWMEVSFKENTDSFRFVLRGDSYGLEVEDGVVQFDSMGYKPSGSTLDARLMIEENVLFDLRERLLSLPGRVQGK